MHKMFDRILKKPLDHSRGFFCANIEHENDILFLKIYTANDVPHPQVLEALGLVNVNPRLFNPPCQSICIPYK